MTCTSSNVLRKSHNISLSEIFDKRPTVQLFKMGVKEFNKTLKCGDNDKEAVIQVCVINIGQTVLFPMSTLT